MAGLPRVWVPPWSDAADLAASRREAELTQILEKVATTCAAWVSLLLPVRLPSLDDRRVTGADGSRGASGRRGPAQPARARRPAEAA
jgi:hypothetical protein